MLPGLGGKGSARQMNQMMRRLGIQVKEIPDVREVVIKTSTKVYTFRDAEVTLMDAQGQKTYQLTGKATVRDITPEESAALGAPAPAAAAAEDEVESGPGIEGSLEDVALEISDEDVALVASQTGKTPKEARAALEAAQGDIAEAIVKLSE
jgi:nascent polypeptide-associated complex subunit alpha